MISFKVFDHKGGTIAILLTPDDPKECYEWLQVAQKAMKNPVGYIQAEAANGNWTVIQAADIGKFEFPMILRENALEYEAK